jgi:hypothetical protein
MPWSTQQRNRLIVRLIILCAIIAVTLLRPKVEAWLSGRSGQTTVSAPSNSSSPTGTPSNPSKQDGAESGEKTPSSSNLPNVEFIEPDDESTAPDAADSAASGSQNGRSEETLPSAEAASATSSAGKPEPARRKKSNRSRPETDTRPDAASSKNEVTDSEPSRTSTPGSVPEVSSTRPGNKPRNESESPRTKDASGEIATDTLGKLQEVRRRVFVSTAGLTYRPGSADGHRLDHVMQHSRDEPSKRIHGVFEGDRDAILATIDEAFLKANQGGKDVRKTQQNDRTVYTVRMNRRVGFAGGEEGARQGNPECRYVRIVLEIQDDVNEVISAYPTKSF